MRSASYAVPLAAAALGLLGCLAASQQTAAPESRDVLLENDRVLVRKVVLEPGIEYPEHTHDRAHVGVIVRGGTLEFHEGGQVERVDFQAGQAGWRDAGVTHRIVNRSQEAVHVVEVELK